MKNSILALMLVLFVGAETATAASWGTCYYNGRKHANTVYSASDNLNELNELCRRQRGTIIQVCMPNGVSSAGIIYRTNNTYFNHKYLDKVGACSKLSPF